MFVQFYRSKISESFEILGKSFSLFVSRCQVTVHTPGLSDDQKKEETLILWSGTLESLELRSVQKNCRYGVHPNSIIDLD